MLKGQRQAGDAGAVATHARVVGDMAARVVVDRSQGASLPGAPIIAQGLRSGSAALGFVGLGTLADRRRTGDQVRRGAMALLAPTRGRLGGRGTRGRNHVLVGTVAARGLVVIRIDVVPAAHDNSPWARGCKGSASEGRGQTPMACRSSSQAAKHVW